MLTRGFSWNDQTVERLRQLINEGNSATRIGLALGCTRNAVIGKASRMKIPLATTNRPVGSMTYSRSKRASDRRRLEYEAVHGHLPDFELPAERLPERGPVIRKTIIQGLTERDCRWPMGHVEGEQTFCCEETVAGYSWCEAHKKRVFVPRASGSMPILDWRARG
jgi:GcrA cell cycle regulator